MAARTEERNVLIRLNNGQALSSIKELNAASRALRAQWNSTASDADRKKIAAEMKVINTELSKQKALTTAAQSGWDKVSGSIMKMGGLIAGMMGFQMITDQFGKMIQKASDLSDQMADVQKTTGLSKGQVDALAKSLRDIDTRSSRKELLGLAYEAGKLGKTGMADIRKFVDEADKINVALGEDLGEGAVLKIGKMAAAFKTGMLNIASAVNTVGQSSMANEGYLVDFTARMQGVGVTANISAADIIGYGAALDSLGIQAETSSTALSTFFIDFIKNTEAFGQMAGFAQGELSALVGAQGTNAGFVAFLERLKEANPAADDFARKLEEMGIDGARGAQTFLALSNNIGMVKDMQLTANDAFAKGSSVLDEFNVKNENLAAKLDKLTKNLGQFMVGSSFMGFIERGATLLNDQLTPATESYEKQLIRVQKELNTEFEVLRRANFSQEQRAEFIKRINTQYGDYLPNLIDEWASLEEIDRVQKEVNKNLLSRILYIRYEEEIKKILEEQVQSVEALAKAEEARTRAIVDPQDASAAALGATQAQIEAMAGLNQFMVDDTDNKIQEVENRYARMAELIGTGMAEIERMIRGTGTDDGGEGGEGGGAGSSGSGKASAEEQKRMQEYIDNTKRLQEQLQRIRIDAIDNVEAREIAALQDAYVRDVQKVEETAANELVKSDLIAALAEETQRKVGIIEREAAQKRVEEFQRQVQAEIDAANDSDLLTLELKLAVAEEGSMAEFEAHAMLLQRRMQMELQNANLTKEQRELIEAEFIKNVEAMWAAFDEARSEKSTEAREKLVADAMQAIDVMAEVFGRMFEFINANYENQIKTAQIAHQQQSEALDKQLRDGIISQEEYNRRKMQLDDEAAAEERALRREQFEMQQAGRVSQAMMAMFSSAVEAMNNPWPLNLVLAAGALAFGGAQVAMIEGEPNPYYKGGRTMVTDSEGYRHNAQQVGSFAKGGYFSSPSLGIVGERGEELVVPNYVLRSPDYADSIAHIEGAIARGYATGGRTSSGMMKQSAAVSTSTAMAGGGAAMDSTAVAAAIDRNTAVMEMLMSGGITARALFEWQDFVDGVYTQETIENTRYFRGSDNRRPGQRI